jgi:nucleotide-binding universal stress UspA family protein
MKRFKKILATTDLSPESLSAVSYAAHLAEAQGAKLTVLHVAHSVSLAYTDFTPPVSMAEIDKAIEESSREELERWAAHKLRKLPRVKLITRRGLTVEVVCEVAEEIDADLIVIATHGRKGLGRAVLGSVTERVIRDAPCPVLVVKPPKPTRKTRATTAKTRK